MFLKCSSNNLSQTVLNLFVQASERYGLPFRIRCDKELKTMMLQCTCTCCHAHSVDLSLLVRVSTINVLNERCVPGSYMHILLPLQSSEGLLDPLNEDDLFSLHYIFLNVINHHHLEEWTRLWNTHKISSVNLNQCNYGLKVP